MSNGKPKVIVYVIVFLLVGIAVGGIVGYYVPHPSTKPSESISVFAAGSLAYALGDHFNPYFKNATGITAGSTFSGSVSGARSVQSGTHYDVFISAAAGVIPSYLSNYTDWMIIFATNEMAVTWLNPSYNITPGQFWFENITAPKVTVAASTSQLDPSGFQAIEMTKLAGVLYTGWDNTTYGKYVKEAFSSNFSLYMRYNNAWNAWFAKDGKLATDGWGGNYSVNDSMALYDQVFGYMLLHHYTKLTTVEIGLDGLLEAHTADYALTYKSQAINQHLYYFQNSNGRNGIPSWINLGSISPSHVAFYASVNSTGPTTPDDNIGNMPATPIFYSVSVLNGTSNLQQAYSYVYYLITGSGIGFLKSSDFDPLPIAYGYNISNIPVSLRPSVESIPSYIPSSAYTKA
ncbi:MAG: substrate-binding domain-containing protein [Thermoplasmatales archaeon]|nr:substrate-binding domain-containing protein [Thermoplasmatales archaeon]MCW6170624.1 substrate-binding domain-containing protein [Thermoplasmatales archaeon]